jgi:hypothetical protein
MFDEIEAELDYLLTVVKDDLAYAKKDRQYYNKATLVKVRRLRDNLSLAFKAAAELNALAAAEEKK